MKLSFEKLIHADLDTVWNTFDNPDNLGRWQQNFASYKHVAGDPGQPGAISELVYNEGNKSVTLRETLTERRAPDFMAGIFESEYGSTIVVNHFEAIDKDTTRWSSWCNITFKGVMKLMSLFMAGSVRKRTEGDMERFKLLVETNVQDHSS